MTFDPDKYEDAWLSVHLRLYEPHQDEPVILEVERGVGRPMSDLVSRKAADIRRRELDVLKCVQQHSFATLERPDFLLRRHHAGQHAQ